MAQDPPEKGLINSALESISSANANRRRKSLSEKIRELGITRPKRRTQSLQLVDIKLEDNRSRNYTLMVPKLNLEKIIYLQPEIIYDEESPEKNVYKITLRDKDLKRQQKISRISDIKVKSYRPSKTIKLRSKRRPSMISRVEQILNKHKDSTLIREPSEESIEFYIAPREKHISDLPESVLQKIFLYFTLQERNLILSKVCKSWYYILKDPMFWTEVVFHGERMEEETMTHLIRRYPTMRRLTLISVPSAINVLQELCRNNNSITHLAVKYCPVSSMDFSRIIHRVISCCINLEVLDIKGMSFHSEGFYLNLGRLKNLRSINLSGNKMLRSQDLITLSINCRNLQELKILDLSLDSEQGSPLRDEDVIFIITHLQTRLRSLTLDMQQLRNVSYQAILKCSLLNTLSLKNCIYLSSEVFRQFPLLQRLRELQFTRAINIKPDDFYHVFANGSMIRIENLDINGCWGVGEVGLRAITQGLNFLRSLSLKNCKSIKGRHLMHLFRCPELTDLNLAHTGVESNQLLSLYQYAKGLATLVIDTNMYKQSVIRQLKRFYPTLKIRVSYSEYQKDERLLEE